MQKYSQYTANKSPMVAALLDKLFEILNEVTAKDYIVEEKQTSLHVVKGSAFLGVHFLKNALRLNIVLDHALSTPKLHKSEQVSKSRFHNEVDLTSLEDFENITGYIKEAYYLK